MGQLMIDIEDNKNSGYFPIQVFETQGASRSAAVIIVPGIPGSDDPHEVVGWCSDQSGEPCDATAIVVGDSGSGQVLMICGGEYGIRLRPASSRSPWDLEANDQTGEPDMLLPVSSELRFLD